MADREDEEEEEQRRRQQEAPGGNATAVDAISERLAEVAELAERLDAALAAGDVSVRRMLDPENWGAGGKTGEGDAGVGAAGERSDDDFLTASECTCTRSSSFHTASECASGGGAASPSSWWEEDQPEEQSQPQQLVTTSVEEKDNFEELSLQVSYRTALKVARSGRPFRDEEYLKECAVSVEDVLCPAEVSKFQFICQQTRHTKLVL